MTQVKQAWFIHKYEIQLERGGPEEGGWWYTSGVPVEDEDWEKLIFTDEEEAYEKCRELNAAEKERQKNEEDYDFHSVLAYKSRHYEYDVSEDSIPHPFPETRPHYE